MNSWKVASVLVLVALSGSLAQDAAPTAAPQTPASTAVPVGPNSPLANQVRQAVRGATSRLQVNMLTVLGSLATTTVDAGQNVTRALATLSRGIVHNAFDLTGVVTYMPRLLLLDMPTQFLEVLMLIRRNEVRVPSDINGAIDSILAMARQTRESGIYDRLFEPVARFLPNMLSGIEAFLQTIIGTTANAFGAGVYRYDPEVDAALVLASNASKYRKEHVVIV